MRHWEFTDETKTIGNTTLKRIRCIADYEYFSVNTGDLGGWVEKEENLGDRARVYDNAQVYGNAQIHGAAKIHGDAQVRGGIWHKSPLYIQGSEHSINMASENELRVGCEIHSLEEWGEKYREIAKEHNAEHLIDEYMAYYELACKLYR